MQHYFRYSFALLLTGCAADSTRDSSSEIIIDKLDLVTEEIMLMQDQIRNFDQKINLLHASVALPDDVLPLRREDIETPAARFDLSSSPYLGNLDAEIAIVEFTDYECPFCRQHFETTYQQLKEGLVETGVVRYYIVDFPLATHVQALPSAVAARCAGEQDRFWEYHDALFSLNSSLLDGVFGEIAHSLNLSENHFSACIINPANQDHVMSIMSQAEQLGVSGTPTFLIGKLNEESILENGMVLHGVRQYSDFDDLISLLLF